MTDLEPVDSVKKLSGQLAISKVGAVLPENMAQVTELAQYMAKAGEMLPKHLRANPAMCMGVIMDAIAWRMNPFRLATQHMVVNGVGSYMSQAITGIINQNAVIQGRLVPDYTGQGDDMVCMLKPVSGSGQVLPYDSPKVRDITPKNSPLWKTDPRQQLFYYSARAWCRRYFPELLMGVYDPDEAREMKDVTPQPVDNFLNDDEPVKAGPGTVEHDRIAYGVSFEMNGQRIDPMTVKAEPIEVLSYGHLGETRVQKLDPETLEVIDDAEPAPDMFNQTSITPEIIAANLERAARMHVTKTGLEIWQQENMEAIAALPYPLAQRVRKAAADRFFDLDEA